MNMAKLKRSLIYPLILMTSVLLSGCFKGEIAVDVKSNGSSVMSIAAGMTSEAKSLAYSNGGNLTQDIQQSLADEGTVSVNDITVTTWRDGDYEWAKAEREFKTLDELQRVMMNRDLFNRFSLTRKRGIFQDEFILDAELDALNDDGSFNNEFGMDPSAFIDMKFSARLPGEIVESNGFADINDPNLIVWSVEGNQPVSVRARSVVWNWLNISGITCGSILVFLIAVYALGGFDSILPSSKRKTKKIDYLSDDPPAAIRHYEKPDYITELVIENLLQQVNTQVLKSSGEIRKQKREIALVWKDAQGKQKYIYIKDLENDQISVNGVNYPATLPNVKAAISAALKNQNSL
jgi:hypothetical protein